MVSALLLGAKMILTPDQLTILAQAAPQTAPQNSPGIGGMLLPMVLMMVLFYFLLIRPQTKREKERKKMVEALKNGDSVVTRGGIVGSVQSVKNDTLTIRSLESKFEVYKDAVERVITSGIFSTLNIYNPLLIGRLILTWFPNPPRQIMYPLATLCDPYLNLFRGIIPPLGGIDLSPILAFTVLNVFQGTAAALPCEYDEATGQARVPKKRTRGFAAAVGRQ